MPQLAELPYHPGIAETPFPQTVPAYAFMGMIPHTGMADTPLAGTASVVGGLATQSYPPRHPERPRTVYHPASFGSTNVSTDAGNDSVHNPDSRFFGIGS